MDIQIHEIVANIVSASYLRGDTSKMDRTKAILVFQNWHTSNRKEQIKNKAILFVYLSKRMHNPGDRVRIAGAKPPCHLPGQNSTQPRCDFSDCVIKKLNEVVV